jgi:hypothetical protein
MTLDTGLPLPHVRCLTKEHAAAYLGIGVTLLLQLRPPRIKLGRLSWRAPKIREKLRRLHSNIRTRAIGTVHAVLYRHGLVNRGRRRRFKAQYHPVRATVAQRPVVRRLQGRVHARGSTLLLSLHCSVSLAMEQPIAFVVR